MRLLAQSSSAPIPIQAISPGTFASVMVPTGLARRQKDGQHAESARGEQRRVCGWLFRQSDVRRIATLRAAARRTDEYARVVGKSGWPEGARRSPDSARWRLALRSLWLSSPLFANWVGLLVALAVLVFLVKEPRRHEEAP